MTIAPEKVQALVELFKRRYPQLTRFDDAEFAREEIGYKRDTIAKAQSLLDADELKRLLEAGQFDEFIGRLETIGRDNNLLYQAVPTTGDLGILYHPKLDKPAFCRAALDLLHGPDAGHLRLTRYTDYVKAAGLPNKWTFPTYFLFICHPESEMFIKPRTTRWFVEFASDYKAFASTPTPFSYVTIKQLAEQLLTDLRAFGPRDMVEIQSFIWVCAWAARQGAGEEDLENVIGLPEPFGSIFQDKGEAEWAFGFLQETMKRLGVTGPDDPRVALTLPRGRDLLRLNFGQWLVLSFFGPTATPNRAQIALLTGLVDVPAEYPAFKQGLDDPEVALSRIPIQRLRNLDALLQAAFDKTLDFIAAKFRDWSGSPFSNSHQKELIKMVFDEEKRRELLTVGLHLPELGFWKISPGDNAWQWEECREQGFIAVGWDELGDVSRMSRPEFKARRNELLAEHADWTKQGVEQVWKFAHIQEGDRIVANRGTSEVLGIGTVTGPYAFVAGVRHGHRLPVRWDDLAPRQVNEGGWRRTLIELDRETFDAICQAPPAVTTASASQAEATVLPAPPSPALQPEYPFAALAADTGFDEATLESWKRAVDRKGQIVMYGPPGTGKTFMAEKLAAHLIGGGDGFSDLVQFHPAYAYEDFMQGLRPQNDGDGGLHYPLLPGRFLEFCRKAAEHTGICVLIIDEINRANLARVFGELMYLLEYRDREIPLAGGRKFKIPTNVRLIGTMNTADRSIALVDHALRRRFGFIGLYPRFEILQAFHAKHGTGFPTAGLIELLKRVNEAIADPHYHLGLSFFLRRDLVAQLGDIWQMEIEPYLEEFFFDQPDKAKQFRWDSVKAGLLP